MIHETQDLIILKNHGGLFPKEKFKPNRFGSVKFDDGKWKEIKEKGYCDQIAKWMISNGLFLRNNKSPYILHHFQNIQFPALTKITLQGNDIESLESLCRINMPSLKFIDVSKMPSEIDTNFIRSVKCFRKTLFQFQSIIIKCNPIVDVEWLREGCLEKMNWMEVEWKAKEPVIGETCAWLLKSNIHNLISLRTQSENRITLAPIFQNCLHQKWQSLQISAHQPPQNN